MGEPKTVLGSTPAGPAAERAMTAGIVVTYEPGPELIDNLAALRPEVGLLIVVDNGSSPASVEMIRAAVAQTGSELIENGMNLGVATALNRGIERALQAGAEWLFLFDQDSRVMPQFVRSMLEAYAASPWGERLKMLVPQYKDSENGDILPAMRAEEGIAVAWTSGSLLRADTVREFGMFRDELFIDEVDHEYSLRLRRAGMVLDETADATLLHAIGAPTTHSVQKKNFRVTNYSPARRYYQERNKIWLARHYGRRFPGFVLSRLRTSLADMWKIVVFEEDKWRKIRYSLRGVRDGLRGRMGKLDERS